MTEPNQQEPKSKKKGCFEDCFKPFFMIAQADKVMSLTIKQTITCNFIFVIILMFIGGILATLKTMEFNHTSRFDDSCVHATLCKKTFELKEDFEGPFYIYIEFENYYVNHRLMAKSFDAVQLSGEDRTISEVEIFCANMTSNAQGGLTTSYTGQTLNSADPMNPCGLLARSFPLDQVAIRHVDKLTIYDIKTTGISLDQLKGKKFKRNPNSEQKQWIDVEHERFINWMQVPPGNSFQVLWGRIDEKIQKGTLEVAIIPDLSVNTYNEQNGGNVKKTIKIVKLHSFLGEYNPYLAYGYCMMAIAA